jgi:hypothetical protein
MAEFIESSFAWFALYGADDRLVTCNRHYRELMRSAAESPTALGAAFEMRNCGSRGIARGQIHECH